MNFQDSVRFSLPDRNLSSLPTGAVKDCVGWLGRKIANGAYAVGETIPMEADLIEELSVSRTVVREAIKVLSGKGMIRTARRYGSRVCPFHEWNLLDPDVISWHSSDSPKAAEIYAAATELRCIVEPEAARLAALHASEEQRHRIVHAAKEIYPHDGDAKAMIAADFAFHATILEGSGNMMLSQLQGLILAVLQFSYPVGARSLPEEKVSQLNHISVADAIVARDSVEAHSSMQTMLEQNRHIAEKLLARNADA